MKSVTFKLDHLNHDQKKMRQECNEMSIHNGGKTVISKRFIRNLKNKYNNTYHSTIKMKPANAKLNIYIDSSKQINDQHPKFKIGDTVRISKQKNVFAKGYTPNWSEEVFLIKKVKNTVSWTFVINDLNGEETVGTFYEKDLQKKN